MDEINQNCNFLIQSEGLISKLFLEIKIDNFASASKFIGDLKYKRNSNKKDLTLLFKENCGTCSTKHAVLKKLVIENNKHEFKLKLGLFRMNIHNTPEISSVLKYYELDYIPKAHKYLRVGHSILDFTNSNSSKNDFIKDLTLKIEIEPEDISENKVNYHKKFLKL